MEGHKSSEMHLGRSFVLLNKESQGASDDLEKVSAKEGRAYSLSDLIKRSERLSEKGTLLKIEGEQRRVVLLTN